MRWLQMSAALLVLMLGPLGLAAAAGHELTVVKPTDGATIEGSTVTITFTTAGIKLVPTTIPVAEAGKHPEANKQGEGHLHFVLDLQPLVVWERGDPYTFANVPPGEHQLMVELVNNDHSSLSPPVMRMIRFRTTANQITPATMPNTGAATHRDTVNLLLILIALSTIVGGLILCRKRV